MIWDSRISAASSTNDPGAFLDGADGAAGWSGSSETTVVRQELQAAPGRDPLGTMELGGAAGWSGACGHDCDKATGRLRPAARTELVDSLGEDCGVVRTARRKATSTTTGRTSRRRARLEAHPVVVSPMGREGGSVEGGTGSKRGGQEWQQSVCICEFMVNLFGLGKGSEFEL